MGCSCLRISNICSFGILDKPTTKENTVLAIGRLTYQKNFLALLEAWYLIQQHTENWKLEIIGDGEEYSLLKQYIEQKNLYNVELKASTTDVASLYEKAEFLVVSSRYEGLSMVLVEAQSFGLPCISFDCPYGPGEVIINNRNGLLVDDQNVEALGKAIKKLIEDSSLRKEFSKNALEDAKRYQKDSILQQWKTKIFIK